MNQNVGGNRKLFREDKVNVDKRKGIVAGEMEGFLCEVIVDWIQLDVVLEFKYFGYVLYESSTDETKCCRKVRGRKVGCRIRSH